MRKRLPVLLTFLMVSFALPRLQSTGMAQEPEPLPPPGKESRPGENNALLLAIDMLQATLSEQRTLIAQTRDQLERERAQTRMTEKRLESAEARRLEIEGRMKELMATLEANARKPKGGPPNPPGGRSEIDQQIKKLQAYSQ